MKVSLEKEGVNYWTKKPQENEEGVEDEEAEAVKEDACEEQRPYYSQHTVAHPQNQARPPVPMATSPRPAPRRAGTG